MLFLCTSRCASAICAGSGTFLARPLRIGQPISTVASSVDMLSRLGRSVLISRTPSCRLYAGLAAQAVGAPPAFSLPRPRLSR